jgi:predicted nucleic acid-binding protein
MNRYLLNASPVTAYLRGRRGAVTLIQPWIDSGEAATSILIYGEVIELFKSLPGFPRRRVLLQALLRQIRTYELTYAILERYADLRRALRPPYGPGLVGDVDTLLAATALDHGLTVVTIDGDFMCIPGLSVMCLDRKALL